MRKKVTTLGVVLLLAAMRLLQSTSIASADQPIFSENFDNWKNPFVAEGWSTHSVGHPGGGYNQIYEAAQEMTTGPGEVNYYRSIYKDFGAQPGEIYSVAFNFIPGGKSWLDGEPVWLQFYDENNRLLHTSVKLLGMRTDIFVPGYWASQAPIGAKRMRLVFQTHPEGALVVWDVVLYKVRLGESGIGNSYERVAGPYINRNTEFFQGVNAEFGSFTFGRLAGEYKLRAVAGSSQGVSCGGTFENYRMLYRDLKVTPGQRNKLSVDVLSNSTNEAGTRTPSPVRVWVQYDDKSGRVLATHGIDGGQAGIKDDVWTTMTVPGPRGEPHTEAPVGADHARIILQVMGGTGGGTLFDNVSFTRVD